MLLQMPEGFLKPGYQAPQEAACGDDGAHQRQSSQGDHEDQDHRLPRENRKECPFIK